LITITEMLWLLQQCYQEYSHLIIFDIISISGI